MSKSLRLNYRNLRNLYDRFLKDNFVFKVFIYGLLFGCFINGFAKTDIPYFEVLKDYAPFNLVAKTDNEAKVNKTSLAVADPCTDGAIVGTPTVNDPDGDGINNSCDLDDDNDGILDDVEAKRINTVISLNNDNILCVSAPLREIGLAKSRRRKDQKGLYL